MTRRDALEILLGFSVAGVLVNGYFALSGNLPPPSFPGGPQLTVEIAWLGVVILSFVIGALTYLLFLKKASGGLVEKDLSKMLIGFFIALLLPGLKLKVYLLIGASLILLPILTYLGFFRKPRSPV